MAFDPDAYLTGGQSPSGFDPDAYLGIEKKKPSFQDQVPGILKQAGQAALASSPANLTKKFFQTDPATMQRVGGVVLPIAGGMVGGPVGAAAGEFARQVTGTAFAPDTVPKTPLGRAASVITAGVAQEPKILEAIPGVSQAAEKAGELAAKAGTGAKMGWSKVVQALTGKPAAKVRQLMEDPSAILPEALGGAQSVEKASAGYGEALENAPIHHPEGFVTRGITKKEFNPFVQNDSDAADLGKGIYDKWKAGEPITAQEAFDAKRATDYTWPKVVSERNQEKIRALSEFKKGMDDVLSSQSGQFLNASKDYARARLGSDFTQLLPRTKTGDISTVKTLLLHTLAPGRSVGMLAGGVTSPAVMGGLTAGTMGATRGLMKLGENPQARQILLQVLQKLRGNQQP